MVKSAISGRAYDEVSWNAFFRLRAHYNADWEAMSLAPGPALEAILSPTTFPEAKARQLPVLLRMLKHRRGTLDLDFLARETVDDAMAWLKALPAVGPKTAACVLNFSRLNMRALVVDTHVHRVTRRLGLSPARGDVQAAYDSLMDQAPEAWLAEELFEFHCLVKRLGQTFCTHARPRCRACPLKEICPRIDAGGGDVLAFWPRA
ncbi:endonuclease III [Caulobacter segnis]|uniref:endonuclease III domain-containing protein n=1 Tax=Caulobacter segnis TaxID=88688 RepID=UPI0024108BA9|nr:endonuclease III [Caulobacter segnis]MDG2522622.1 endonuclease III [Caulobacter segnis]